MTIHVADDALLEAQRKINAILGELEALTGAVVKDLWLDRIEVSSVDDVRPRFLASCVLEMERVPSHDWSV